MERKETFSSYYSDGRLFLPSKRVTGAKKHVLFLESASWRVVPSSVSTQNFAKFFTNTTFDVAVDSREHHMAVSPN
jgi:hypothetical protein